MELKSSYNIDGGAIVKQGVAINYLRRIPMSSEKISEDIKNDPVISLESKMFYLKVEGEQRLSSYKVQCPGVNNLWLNLNTRILNF